MKTIAQVKLWDTEIGAVSIDEGETYAYFEYADSFVGSGIEVSPVMMPLRKGVYRFPNLAYESFNGLPGLLSDSLPDKYGHELIDLWLAKQGRLPQSLNPVERLCYVGTRGMGALEFYPISHEAEAFEQTLYVDALVELASEIVTHRSNLHAVLSDADAKKKHAISQIISIGTSAGGARAKALIALNPKTLEVRSGQIQADSDFEYWLLKFSGVRGNKDKEAEDLDDFGLIEFVYAQIAQKAGITMSECRILDDGTNKHFMTKRFDRIGGQKLHMHTLAGLAHFDFNQARAYSYEQAFTIIKKIGCKTQDINELFKRMVFNIVGRNQDDHVKNISFLMDRRGTWSLAPAYDISFAYNPTGLWTGKHQMSVNGKHDTFELDDFAACAKSIGLKQGAYKRIIDEVQSAFTHWPELASHAGIREERIQAIEGYFRKL